MILAEIEVNLTEGFYKCVNDFLFDLLEEKLGRTKQAIKGRRTPIVLKLIVYHYWSRQKINTWQSLARTCTNVNNQYAKHGCRDNTHSCEQNARNLSQLLMKQIVDSLHKVMVEGTGLTHNSASS